MLYQAIQYYFLDKALNALLDNLSNNIRVKPHKYSGLILDYKGQRVIFNEKYLCKPLTAIGLYPFTSRIRSPFTGLMETDIQHIRDSQIEALINQK